VENRFVGMKSRGVYETPGGTILLTAHRAMESITLDRGAGAPQGRADAALRGADLQRLLVLARARNAAGAIDQSQEHVEGEVTLKLYKGNVIVTGRGAPKSLYSEELVTFEDDRGAYDQKDAEGFIRLNALRLRTLAARDRKRPISTTLSLLWSLRAISCRGSPRCSGTGPEPTPMM
jgi:argininosuccinate synthase